MNISTLFIKRPVATTVLMVGLFIFGLFAYPQLPISELPNVDFPTIMVSASMPGADPETMASAVATPLEKELSTISGVESMSSVSSSGQTRITLQFALSRNIDAAAQDVQGALLEVASKLPPQMTTSPSIRKTNPAESPILYLVLTGKDLPLTKLDAYAENKVSPRLSMVDGVAQVDVYGAQQYAVRIHLNPYALTSRGLDIDKVVQAIADQNTNQPTGTLQTDGFYRLLKADGNLNNASSFSEAMIAPNVKLKDIANVEDSIANDKAATWYNGQRAIMLAVERQPGANTVKVVQNVLKLLPQLSREIPGDGRLEVVYDRSVFIKAAIRDVQFTLFFAVFLVIAVIYLFLKDKRSTFIAGLSLPVSLIATFGVMYLCNYNIDNLSLMGLVLAVGFVIDDAVVVLENIMRYREKGFDRFQASLLGSKEIGFTVLSMTLSLVAVFIPIFFMGGIIGKLFQEFAAVVGISILLSGVVALTLIPMLCSRFLDEKKELASDGAFERFYTKSKATYERTLVWALDHTRIIFAASGFILLVTFFLFHAVSKGFIPSEDTNMISGTVQAGEGITFPEFVSNQQKAAEIIQKNKNVVAVVSTVGQGDGGVSSGNSGKFIIELTPKSQRNKNVDQLIQELRYQLEPVTGLKIFLTNPPTIRIGGKVSNSMYQYVLQGANWKALQQASDVMQAKMRTIAGVQDVNSDVQMNNPELQLHILREKAASLGVTPAQIETALYYAYGGASVSSIMTADGDYNVIVDIDPAYQHNKEDINLLTLQSSSGAMVPLSAVVEKKEGAGPLSISHYGQLPAVTLSFNLAPGVSLGSVTNQIVALAKQTLPPEITGVFSGAAQTFQQSLKSLPLLLFFTILIIYMVLAILYENFIHPLTILTALPFAVFGALFSLALLSQELDIFSFIGLIMLVGLTKKNGIMMVDFAIEAQKQKTISAHDAILEACLIRFRPIMMTTVAAIVATLPIALGLGAGGETRRGLGIAVVGGLFFSQLITLYVTPVFYQAFSRVANRK